MPRPGARVGALTVHGELDGDGGHADFLKVPAHTLIRLPDSLSFKTGAAISCGTGTAFGASPRGWRRPDSSAPTTSSTHESRTP
ncbi:hypothetical protein ACFYQA_34605 [Streptomyces sp. NPDC005774]|uniref:hypothetical protein n=1 Tax=Streptomyces sp. NPDC005774 TaxID=3364728 RepID=UPI0036A508D5